MGFYGHLIFVITGVSAVLAVPQSLELTLNPAGDITEGDTLSITCRVTGKNRFDIVRLTREFEGETAVISNNQFIETVFLDTGRYRNVEYGEASHVTTIITEIADIQGRDGGRIACSLLPAEISALEEVNVYVSPQKVEILHQNRTGAWVAPLDGAVTIKKGTMSGIMCKVVVDGTPTEPDINIALADADASHMFAEEETFDQNMAEGFKNVVRVTDLKYVTDDANIDHHNKVVRCSAKLPKLPVKTANATIQVEYSPQLNCDSRWTAKIGSKNIRISCRGQMFPAPQVTAWSFGKRPNRTVLTPGETYGNLSVQQSDLGDATYEFVLAISEVGAQHFNKYKLEVSNGVGPTAEAFIRFHEEEESQEVEIYPTSGIGASRDRLDGGKGYLYDNGGAGPLSAPLALLLVITLGVHQIATVLC